MTARIAAMCSSLAVALAAAACVSAHKVAIDTPTHATVDVAPFLRVLVAGFIGGGNAEVDTSVETVRLLRSQLRSKTSLKVIEADLLPLAQIAAQQESTMGDRSGGINGSHHGERRTSLTSENDLEARRHVFANTVFWKRLGEEYQDPLIVTGTLFFTPRRRGGSLKLTLILIDGRTGTVMHSETFREHVSDGRRDAPALSSYFRLMDRMLPRFLSTVSDQTARGTRTLLR